MAGLVLVHTTYTNPVRTTQMAGLYTAIEKPVLIPLLYLTIALWPLVWLMNWLSYFNGSVHRSTHKSSFSGAETRGQLDFIARFMPRGRPDVLARGMLGMIAYDATATLPGRSTSRRWWWWATRTPRRSPRPAVHRRECADARLVTLSPAKHWGHRAMTGSTNLSPTSPRRATMGVLLFLTIQPSSRTELFEGSLRCAGVYGKCAPSQSTDGRCRMRRLSFTRDGRDAPLGQEGSR